MYFESNSYKIARLFNKNIKSDALLSPLLYIANNVSSQIVTHLCDMPLLVHREIATSISNLAYFKKLYKDWQKQRKYNDLDIVNFAQNIIIDTKINYIGEVLKQVSYSSKNNIAIVPKGWIPYIENYWKNMDPEPKKLIDLLKLPKLSLKEALAERVEKHIILELLTDTYITEFYILNKYFPFNYDELMGARYNDSLGNVALWKSCMNEYTKN